MQRTRQRPKAMKASRTKEIRTNYGRNADAGRERESRNRKSRIFGRPTAASFRRNLHRMHASSALSADPVLRQAVAPFRTQRTGGKSACLWRVDVTCASRAAGVGEHRIRSERPLFSRRPEYLQSSLLAEAAADGTGPGKASGLSTDVVAISGRHGICWRGYGRQ